MASFRADTSITVTLNHALLKTAKEICEKVKKSENNGFKMKVNKVQAVVKWDMH